jgi:pimeloyl-ACP methyl ester carboxylesterase
MQALIVFISGFTQSEKRFNGVFRQFRNALVYRRQQRGEGARIEYRTWRYDWEAMAEYSQHMLDPGGVVYIVGYSWGGGWGARRYTQELANRGIEVPELLLCDAVYRSSVLPVWAPANIRSVFNSGPLAPKIEIPSNVRNVHWLRQRENKPQGHDVSPVNPQRTALTMPVLLKLPHSEMDESDEFAEMSFEMVDRALKTL